MKKCACLLSCILIFLSIESCSKNKDSAPAVENLPETSLQTAQTPVTEYAFINSKGGLKLKATPEAEGKTVCELKDKTQVEVLTRPAAGAEASDGELTKNEPVWLQIKTADGKTGYVLSRYIEDSLEAIDFIRTVEGSYNESGKDSDQKITIKYIGNKKFDVDANWKMFQSKNLLTAEEIEKSDFLIRSGSRDGVQVDYKLHFADGELNYDFVGQYWDFDTDNNPVNRRESRINTKLKRIESE